MKILIETEVLLHKTADEREAANDLGINPPKTALVMSGYVGFHIWEIGVYMGNGCFTDYVYSHILAFCLIKYLI